MKEKHLRAYQVVWNRTDTGMIYRTAIIAYTKDEAIKIMSMWFDNVKRWPHDLFMIQEVKLLRGKKYWFMLTEDRYERQLNLVMGEHK